MEIYINGKSLTLNQNEFVAKGGEGSVFKRGNTAFKIYTDLARMIAPAKVKELELCDHPSILRPKDLILNKKRQNIGFTMDWVGDDTIALCKLFTTTFRDKNNIENDLIIELIENIKKLINFIHDRKCLIVDGNELNYLVDPSFKIPYMIDVNSWQTPSYQATAIMPSIRDWSTDEFTPLSDWFSFAIIAFQLFIGIHPFKGKHKSYRKNDFINRVKDSVSVFDPQVSLPPTTRDFNLIPSAYKDWFYQTFQHGVRSLPPLSPGDFQKVHVAVKLVQSTGAFEITMLREIDDRILYHNPELNITKTPDKLYIGKTDYKVSRDVELLYTPLEQLPILVKIEENEAKFKLLTSGYTIKEVALAATEFMIVDNHLYLKNGQKLIEMDFKVMGTALLPVVKTVWNIEELSSILYSNVVYQSVLGKSYLCIPDPNVSGMSSFHIKAIPELDNYRVLEAKHQNRICMLIVHGGSNYDRAIIVFDDKFQKYTFRLIRDVDYMAPNFVVLDNGVCITITEDNAVEIFLNRIDKTDVKRIEDPDIDNTMKLCKDGTTALFTKDKAIYKLKMK